MNFNKERFANFAKYDLTINKAFYRNLVMVTLIGAIGIAVACFFFRYSMWKSVTSAEISMTTTMTSGDEMIQQEYQGDLAGFSIGAPGTYAHFNSMFMSTIIMIEFLGIMGLIFAGCWAHNLRNKQGRLMELTLPATNLEKYLWHTGLMIVGGWILLFLSLLIADGANAMFTWMLCPAKDGIGSLTANCFSFVSMDLEAFGQAFAADSGITYAAQDEVVVSVLKSVSFLIFCSSLCTSMIYLFGNAVKYKYNIILTYIAMYVLEILVAIVIGISMATVVGNQHNWDLHPSDGPAIAKAFAYIWGSIELIIAVALPIVSYRLYTKAQITSKMNK